MPFSRASLSLCSLLTTASLDRASVTGEQGPPCVAGVSPERRPCHAAHSAPLSGARALRTGTQGGMPRAEAGLAYRAVLQPSEKCSQVNSLIRLGSERLVAHFAGSQRFFGSQ